MTRYLQWTRALVLAAWSGFFIWLLVSGEVARYIGPKTEWVIIFGACALTAATLGQLWSLRTPSRGGSPNTAESLGYAVLLAPLAIVLLVPHAALGAMAAEHKVSSGLISAGASAPIPVAGEEVSFVQIHFASESADYAAALGISDGYPVTLTGFVSEAGDLPVGTLGLTRFSIFCCAADAIPYTVPFTASGSQLDAVGSSDQWITVAGQLEQQDGQYVLKADSVRQVDEPSDPYIHP